MKAHIFLKYGSLAASSRYRLIQFTNEWKKIGFQTEYSSLLDNTYLEKKFKNNQFSFLSVLIGFFYRLYILLTIRKYDFVIIYCELFPFFPSIFEHWIHWNGVPYILDLDDAIFHKYDSNKNPIIRFFLKNKIAKIMKYAHTIWAGNEYLADYAKKYCSNTYVHPTVIDLNKYKLKKWMKNNSLLPFTIGWIGSPSTSKYLKEIEEELNEFSQKHPTRIVIIGAGDFRFQKVEAEYLPWDEESEILFLHQFDVGIMPLTENSNWEKGKCAFKLIQYSACGIPAIGTNLPANAQVIHDKFSGFLIQNKKDWIEAFDYFYNNPLEKEKFGNAGRKIIENKYSLQSLLPKTIKTLKSINTH